MSRLSFKAAIFLFLAFATIEGSAETLTLSGVVPACHDVEVKYIPLTSSVLTALGRGEQVEVARLYETDNAAQLNYRVSASGRSDYEFSLDRPKSPVLGQLVSVSRRVSVLLARRLASTGDTVKTDTGPVVVSIAVQ